MNLLSTHFFNIFGGQSKEEDDKIFYDQIKNTKLFQESTKAVYIDKLKTVQNEFFDEKKSLYYVMTHPQEFKEALLKYKSKHSLADRTTTQYIAIIISLFMHNTNMLEEHNDKFKMYKTIKKDMSEEIEDQVLSNKPTIKQAKGLITLNDIIETRDKLDKGSDDRLLLSLYTMIPPLRSNFDNVKILNKDSNDNKNNYIVLTEDKNQLILNRYKTAPTYDKIIINLPDDLVSEINESLKQKPRDYLFVEHGNKPYTKANSWNAWANRRLKKLFNTDFSLTMFRHIYLSNKDLKLNEKTLKERKKISDIMGHSLDTQSKYIWK